MTRREHMKTITTILLIILFISCRQGDIRKTYYKSGKIESEFEYQNDKKNGDATFYYENGEVQSKVVYKNEQLVGQGKFYDENGDLYLEFNYDTQEAKEYTEGGKHYEVGKITNNKKNGIWKEYLTSGDELINEFTYVDDAKTGPCKNYWSDNSGKIYKTGFFKNGLLDSVWTTYNKDGKVDYKETWKPNPNGKSSSSFRKAVE